MWFFQCWSSNLRSSEQWVINLELYLILREIIPAEAQICDLLDDSSPVQIFVFKTTNVTTSKARDLEKQQQLLSLRSIWIVNLVGSKSANAFSWWRMTSPNSWRPWCEWAHLAVSRWMNATRANNLVWSRDKTCFRLRNTWVTCASSTKSGKNDKVSSKRVANTPESRKHEFESPFEVSEFSVNVMAVGSESAYMCMMISGDGCWNASSGRGIITNRV